MSKYSNTVEYKIKTSLDATGLTKLQQQLRQVQAEFERMSTAKTPFSGLEEAKKQLTEIQTLVNSAFNPKLGMMDTKALTAGLTRVQGGLSGIYKNFSAAGAVGKQAFAGLVGQTAKLDVGLKQVSSTSDKIFNTLGNTVRWGLIASAFSSVMNAAHESVQYVKDLDESLTNIMMVTEYSRDAMNDYAKAANEAAKSLGSTTTAMTNATLVFAQQGFDLPQSQELAQTSVQLANISQQDTATASDEITAYMNAFNLDSIDEINNAMSKWAIVANVSAADVQELSIASQKAASTAVTVGVNMDQLAAQIAAIETVTREAPENIGNGLKTLYARLSDIGMGETVDGDVNLGKVTSTLEKVGVQVLTAEGNMRQVGDIMEDLMEVWGGLDLTQRTSIATTLAGKYQLSRFTALMNRSDLYQEYLSASEGETGTETFDEMQAKFEDSMQGRLNTLQAAIEGIFTNAFETDNFYAMIDAVTGLVEVFADLTEAIGGGSAAMTAFLAVGTKMFSGSIGKGIANFISNRQTNALRESNQQALAAQAKQTLADKGLNTGDRSIDAAAVDFATMNQYRPNMTAEQSTQANGLIEQRVALLQEEIQLREDLATQIAIANAVSEDADGQSIRTQEELLEYARKLKLELAEMDPKSLEQSAPVFNQAIASLEKMQKSLQGVREGIELVNSGQETLGWDKIINSNVISTLEKLRQQLSLTGEEDLELAETIDILSNAFDGVEVDLAQLNKGLDTAGIHTDQLIQRLEKAFEKTNMQSSALIKTRDSMVENAVGQEMNQKQSQGIGEQVEAQEFATGVANAVGSVGQLIFAWQSFQNLGSLWANADMDLGQKVEETILNLAMSLPMLITGFTQLKSSVDGLDFNKVANQIHMTAEANKDAAAAGERNANIAKLEVQAEQARQRGAVGTYTQLKMKIMAEREDAQAATVSTAKSSLAGVAYRAQGMAATAAAVGVRTLGAAMNFLASGPGIALIAILTAVGTAWSAYTQQMEEAYRKEKEKAEETLSSYNSISDKIDSFNELYEKFQQTGEVTDELVDSSKSLSETLSLTGGEAQIAAGRFDLLAESIAKAKGEQRKLAERDIESFLAGSNAKSLQGGIGNGSIYSDLRSAVGSRAMYDEFGNQISAGKNNETLNAIDAAQAKNSPAEAIKAINQQLKQYNDEADNLDTEIKRVKSEGGNAENLEIALKNKLAEIDKLNEALSTEDVADWVNQMGSLSGLRAQDLDLEQKTSYQEIVDTFFNDQYIGEYLESLGNWSDQLTWMIQNTSDETAKLKLMLKQAEENASSILYEKAKGAAETNSFTTDRTETSEDIGNAFSQYALNEIKSSGLTEKQQLTFLAGIDENASIENILQQIEEIKQNPDLAAETLELHPTLTNRGDLSDADIDQVLKDSGRSEQSFMRQSQDIYNSEGFQSRAAELKENIAAINENNFKNYVEDAEDAEEATERLREQLGDLASEAKDTAAANIRLNKGVQKLEKAWEDFGEVLTDDVSKGTADWYNAVAELDEGISDIVNIDVGVLSNDFYENAEAIQAMQDAATGDMDAVDRLRDLANEDIIMHMEVQNISEEDLSVLRQQLITEGNDLQATLDSQPLSMSMKVGAFDDSSYVQHLNQLLSDSQITAEQASNALSSIGMGYTIEYHDAMVEVPQYTYHMEGDLSALLSGKSTADVTVAAIPQGTKSFPGKAPQIVGTHYTGPGVGSVGGSSRPSGGGGGGSCFITGTKVSMCGYYKNIEDVKIGDVVLSYNEELKRNEYSEVVQTMIHNRKERLHTLYVENDKITATGNHTFLIARAGKEQWVAAENLQINDLMLLANGSWSRLHTIVVTTKLVKTYNFEVSNTHNYYVGEKQILAHNKGGKKSCFVAGTEIAMRGYHKNIEDIKPGDIVLSYNEKLHKNQYSIVLQTMIHDTTEKLYNLYIENEKLTVTGIHRFLISRNNNIKWIPASELRVGDEVLFSDSTWHKISVIVISTQTCRVYNFEVSNNHNYYVGRNQILAHNKGGGKKNEPKEVNRTEAATAENDIYEKVNATLKKLEDQYSKTEKVANRLWGDKRRQEIEKQLTLLDKEKATTKERLEIARAYAKALKTGKSNLAYGINMEGKDSQNLKKYGLTDKNDDGVVDNYIAKFEQARLAAQAADKAADAYYKKQGGKINKKGEVTKEAKMTEAQEKEYKKLTDHAKKLWEKAEGINKATKEYEDTMAQIREDDEKLVELQQQMEDLAIDMYETALDATDALKDLKDVMAEIKGWQSGFNTDSPFRDLIEDSQRLSDIMRDDNFDIAGYYDDTIDKLKQMRDQYKKGSDEYKAYAAEIKFNEQEKQAFLNNSYGIGTGELAQSMMHFNQLQHWFDNAQKGKSNLAAPYGTDEADLLKQYEEYYKDFTKLILETEERVEAMQKSAVKTMEESADRQEKVLKKYDKIQDDLERTSKRVALWQGDDAYKAQAEISKQMAATAKSAAKAKKELYDTWKAELDAQKALEDANRKAKIDLANSRVKELEALLKTQTKGSLPWLDTKAELEAARVAAQRAKTDYSDAVDTLQEQVDDMWEQIKDDQDTAAEAMEEAYLATVDEINAAMTERLFGDRNLSNLTDDWDWDKDYFTTYKDTVEEAYEKEKLRLKYMDLLDDAQGMSLGIQRQIRDAMNEQLALLDGQATLSQYDVDLANARLEILQKQIALENAQQNKTQMKLRRDTQGNYKYVYSADQDDVRDKESELLDAQFDAYEMSKDANRNSYDSAISMYNQYVEQRKALAEKYKDDREKLDEELKKLDDNYTRAAEANAEDLKNSYDGMVLSVEWMAKSNVENIANMTDEVLEGLKEHNQEALEAIGIPWNDAIGKAIEDFDKIKDEAADTSAELIANAADFGDFISGDEGIGAVTGEQYGQAKEAIDSAKDATEGLKKETENLNKALTQELGATSAAEEKIAEYEAQLTKAKKSSSALSQKLQSAQQDLVDAKEEQKKSQMAYQAASEESAAMKRMSSGKFQKGDEFYLDKGTVVYYGRGAGQTDSKGRNSYTLKKKTKVVVQNPDQRKLDGSGKLAEHHVGFYPVDGQGYSKMIPDQDNPPDRIGEQWHLSPALIKANLSFDTGGYTGEWDDDGTGLKGGRLAWLHQKELILNADDTENILMAVDVVRQITEGIKTLAAGAHLQGMSQFDKQSQGDTIEQRVEIIAEFPNANSAEEIRRALLGLADSAMQYSYREKNLVG